MANPRVEDEGMLREWAPLTDLLGQIPIKAQRGLFTQELNLTCVDALPEFLVVGTNMGLVYWYNRKAGDLQRLRFENTAVAVTCVKVISTVDYMVAAGSDQGTVTVFQIPKIPPDNLPESMRPKNNKQVERYTVGGLHTGPVTTIEWSMNGMKLFSGDKSGLVVFTEIDFYMASKKCLTDTLSGPLWIRTLISGARRSPSGTSTRRPSILSCAAPKNKQSDPLHLSKSSEILNEKYEIVQLSYSQQLLLVSTSYRSIVCHRDDRWKVAQVGQKERKALGHLGATFCVRAGIPRQLVVYASRPGLRLWQANKTGVVEQTLIYKDMLTSPHPQAPLINPCKSHGTPGDQQFGPLHVFNERLLVTHSADVVYVLDPDSIGVVATVTELRGIQSLAVTRDEIFVLEGPRSLIRVAYSPENSVPNGQPQGGREPQSDSLFMSLPVSLSDNAALSSLLDLTYKIKDSTIPFTKISSTISRLGGGVEGDSPTVVTADEALELPPIVPLVGGALVVITYHYCVSEVMPVLMYHYCVSEVMLVLTYHYCVSEVMLVLMYHYCVSEVMLVLTYYCVSEVMPVLMYHYCVSEVMLVLTYHYCVSEVMLVLMYHYCVSEVMLVLTYYCVSEVMLVLTYHYCTDLAVEKPVSPAADCKTTLSLSQCDSGYDLRLGEGSLRAELLDKIGEQQFEDILFKPHRRKRSRTGRPRPLVSGTESGSDTVSMNSVHSTTSEGEDPWSSEQLDISGDLSSTSTRPDSSDYNEQITLRSSSEETLGRIDDSCTPLSTVVGVREFDEELTSQDTSRPTELPLNGQLYLPPEIKPDLRSPSSIEKAVAEKERILAKVLNLDSLCIDHKTPTNTKVISSEINESILQNGVILIGEQTNNISNLLDNKINSFNSADNNSPPSSFTEELSSTLKLDEICSENLKRTFACFDDETDSSTEVSDERVASLSSVLSYGPPSGSSAPPSINTSLELEAPEAPPATCESLTQESVQRADKWVQYKVPDSLTHLSVCRNYVCCVDSRDTVYYSALDGLGLKWHLVDYRARQVVMTQDGNLVWKLFKNVAYALETPSVKGPFGVGWVEAATDVQCVAVDDGMAWFVSLDGRVYIQKLLNPDMVCGVSTPVHCAWPVTGVCCFGGSVLVLTNTGEVLSRQMSCWCNAVSDEEIMKLTPKNLVVSLKKLTLLAPDPLSF
uniref:Uncharacterized protein n=1 Tax=Timema monikensis TaxID=170555 RepID=A0A7R9E340_9NEOP|nr:unnamed protein product [Timema monikensis]